MRSPVLVVSLATLSISTSAFAADRIVDSAIPNHLVTQAAAAVDGDRLVLNPGLHYLDQQVVVNRNITIQGAETVREIDSMNVDEYATVTFDLCLAFIDDTFDGAFRVAAGKRVTFTDVLLRQPEIVCADRADSDGNGLADDDDPYCQYMAAQNLTCNELVGEPRAIVVAGGRPVGAPSTAELTLNRVMVQGWSGYAPEGAAVHMGDGTLLNVTDSFFVSNATSIPIDLSGQFIRGRGTVYATKSAVVDVVGSRFYSNGARFGGGIYVNDGSSLTVAETAFWSNSATEDGGAIHTENAIVNLANNVFSLNGTAPVGGASPAHEYEGAALYFEDSLASVYNNIFLQNGSAERGAAITVRRSLDGLTPPEIVNNTFVGNTTRMGGATVWLDNIGVRYINNINYLDTGPILGAENWSLGSVPNVLYNDFFLFEPRVFSGQLATGAVDTTTNIFDDPEFVFYGDAHEDWTLWNFVLRPDSPAVDAGDPGILDKGGTRSDMGAYGGQLANVADEDGDGWINVYDCDDTEPSIFPFAAEPCDDIDNDCDGIVDNLERTWYRDGDLDGYGDPAVSTSVCPGDGGLPPAGAGAQWVEQGGDCDDTNAARNPGRAEICDDLDNDCDGVAEDNIPVVRWYRDGDRDGFGRVSSSGSTFAQCPPNNDYAGYSPYNVDCDDAVATKYPLITEDVTGHPPLAGRAVETNEADRNPLFVGDGIDQDCDGTDLCYVDVDGDSYGANANAEGTFSYVRTATIGVLDCDLNAGMASSAGDCNDRQPAINPDSNEIVGDGIDQNCDGRDRCYVDLDGDGYGSEDIATSGSGSCGAGGDPTAARTGDCDDSTTDVRPGLEEICDGRDNNCDGQTDEGGGDDDDLWFQDSDGDGYGNNAVQIYACAQTDGTPPLGYAAEGNDCDDADNRVYPAATEYCDGVDNNCVGGTDESSAVDAVEWYQDGDGDGYGNPEISTLSCYAPEDGRTWVRAGVAFDCDDLSTTTGASGCCGGCTQGAGSGGLAASVSTFVLAGMLRRRRRD